ncbi:MAG: rod shape-determining protein RodA [Saprospiraceae bacterium]|jgi:rod shape determining protein RodA|nr:rod shape-determining protein RodA [Saprospiraceae bacterium]MBK7796138.1 rod shape-determining protein RodA [Saprospiraceae bacterium]MBK8151690.1 rod shape-determining protein RodA [Saprospiraceae bacterium]MBL0261223.1 rod shape-determining protein RodA [Saprospiraceae bacterium]
MSIRKERILYDWVTIGIYISMLCIGWMAYYAVTYTQNEGRDFFDLSTPITKQTVFTVTALLVFITVTFIDWKFWQNFAYIFYGAGLVLLILVLIFGSEIKGAKAWFSFGGFSFQPAEIAKLGTALALSAYLSNFKTDLKVRQYQLVAIGLILVPVFLILLQPDAGSALTFFSFFLLLFVAGLNEIYFLIGAVLIATFILSIVFPLEYFELGLLIIIPIIAWYFSKRFPLSWAVLALSLAAVVITFLYLSYWYWIGIGVLGSLVFLILLWRSRQERLSLALLSSMILLTGFALMTTQLFLSLDKHQQERINVWLKPSECDPRGSLYNILQSKVAIGSGGFWGKGFLKGNMTKLRFVPEQSTDFIFSTIGEEHGFIGAVLVVTLFTILMLRIMRTAESISTKFISYYSIGLAGLLLVHVLVNIGMTIGLMPIIGIPLPFISKGGSSLIGFSLMLGIYIRMQAKPK